MSKIEETISINGEIWEMIPNLTNSGATYAQFKGQWYKMKEESREEYLTRLYKEKFPNAQGYEIYSFYSKHGLPIICLSEGEKIMRDKVIENAIEELESIKGFEFKCEDGIVNDPEQTIYGVLIKAQWQTGEWRAQQIDRSKGHTLAPSYKSDTWKFFKDEQKRAQYIFKHKPMLSLQDIEDIDHAGNGKVYMLTFERLNERIKSKL